MGLRLHVVLNAEGLVHVGNEFDAAAWRDDTQRGREWVLRYPYKHRNESERMGWITAEASAGAGPARVKSAFAMALSRSTSDIAVDGKPCLEQETLRDSEAWRGRFGPKETESQRIG